MIGLVSLSNLGSNSGLIRFVCLKVLVKNLFIAGHRHGEVEWPVPCPVTLISSSVFLPVTRFVVVVGNFGIVDAWTSGVSGQAVQPKPLASLKLSMAVYGQKLDGRPSR